MSSELLDQLKLDGDVPRHVAIIMDGNGRWARERGQPREFGHRAGMKAVRETIEGSVEAGVPILTLFAFSQENWHRPAGEVQALMSLLELYVRREAKELRGQGVEVRVLGELDRLGAAPRRAVDRIVEYTRGGSALKLNIALSYGARAEIVRAARQLAERVRRGSLLPAEIDEELFSSELFTAGFPDPDLLVRTSGEFRISNFMLWQLAYTELHVSPVLWPDFSREHLFAAIRDYQRRERRFGRVATT
jgi:undecaprenyl diphosphate synthase